MPSGSSLEELPAFDEDRNVQVVVETSAGSRNKLKYDAHAGAFIVRHMLPAGSTFPHDFGFVPSTRGGDGDPLDALVFGEEPLPPGTIVPCRIIGVLEATQTPQGGKPARNDRFLAVPVYSHLFADWRELRDVPSKRLDDLEAFFVFYNAQRGTRFRPKARRGRKQAMVLLEAGVRARKGK